MSKAFDWITVIISAFLLIKNIKKISKSSRYLIYFLFLFFYVAPLMLDVVFMKPEYTKSLHRGFTLTRDDELTRCLYDVFVIYAQFVILYFQKNRASHGYMKSIRKPLLDDKLKYKWDNVYVLVLLGAVFPIILSVILPVNKAVLYTFQWREYDVIDYNKYFGFIEKFTYMGTICTMLLLTRALNKRDIGLTVFCGITLFMNVCIQGKRSILFFALLVYILIMFLGLQDKSLDQKSRRRKIIGLLFVVITVVVIMIGMTLVVKVTSRGYEASDKSQLYTALRIDFFRDDRVRLAMYHVLHPSEMKILDWPGQSLLPFPTWLFPFDYILGKLGISYPAYTNYFSSAVLMLPRSQSFTNMTPCIYAELVSNFGLFGALAMPFLCVWFAIKADKYPYPFNVFIIVSYIVLQMYAISYMAYYFEFVFFMCWFLKSDVKFVVGNLRRAGRDSA